MSGFQVGFLNRGRGGNVKRKRRKKKRPASKGCSGETKEALIVSSGANITTSKESTTSVEPAPTAYDYYSKEKMPEILEMGYSMEEAEVKLSDQWSNLPGQTIKHYHEVSRKGLLNFKKEEIKKLNDQIHTARNKSKELMSVKKQLEAQADRLKGEYIQVTQKNNHTTGLYNEAYRMMKDQKMHCQNEIALVRSEVLEMQKALKAAKIAGVKKKEKHKKKPQKFQQDDKCMVCFDVLMQLPKRSIATLACNHSYHLSCIGTCFNTKKGNMACPTCRSAPEKNKEEKNNGGLSNYQNNWTLAADGRLVSIIFNMLRETNNCGENGITRITSYENIFERTDKLGLLRRSVKVALRTLTNGYVTKRGNSVILIGEEIPNLVGSAVDDLKDSGQPYWGEKEGGEFDGD